MPRVSTLNKTQAAPLRARLNGFARVALQPLPLLIVFVAALVARWFLHLQHANFSYGTSIFGLPYSDAFEWQKLAESILRGGGMVGPWSGQRPVFPYLLASVFLWFGPTVASGAATLAACSALVIVLLYAAGTRIAGVLCGSTLVAWALISAPQRAYSLQLMSEIPGLALLLGSVVAIGLAREQNKARYAFIAGALGTLSNLCRPLTLPALPLIALWLLLPTRRRPRAISVPAGAAFILGIVLTMAPWLARQYAQFGILSITDKTAESFYAATAEHLGRWTSAVDVDAEQAGVGPSAAERYRFFSARAMENLRNRPELFLQRAGSSVLAFLESAGREWRTIRFCAALLILVGLAYNLYQGASGPFRLLAIVPAGIILAICGPKFGSVVCAALLIYLGISRGGIALATVWYFLGALIGLALVNEGDNERFHVLTTWMFAFGLFGTINTHLHPPHAQHAPAPLPRLIDGKFFWAGLVWAAFAFFSLSGAILYRRIATTEAPTTPAEEDLRALITNDPVASRIPAELRTKPLVTMLAYDLDASRNEAPAVLTGTIHSFVFRVPSGLTVPWAGPLFQAIPAERQIAWITPFQGEPTYLWWCGAPLQLVDQPVAVAGVLHTNTRYPYLDGRRLLEAVAIVPMRSMDGTWQVNTSEAALGPLCSQAR